MKTFVLVVAATLVAAGHARAQEYEVTRRQFTFFDNSLTVEVVADMPGQLQVVRGEPGRIEVAARVPGGIPAFAMGGRENDKLRLTAVGGSHADFVVIIPEDATVRVQLPDRHGHQVKSLQRSGKYTWGDGSEGSTRSNQGSAKASPVPAGPTTAYSNAMAPRLVNVTKMNSVRTVSVRFEGGNFNVAGTRYMSVQDGDPNNIEVRTSDDVQDVIVTVPVGTSSFTLKLAGKTAMNVVGAEIRTYCDPLTEQDLGAGRRWYTFTPEMGRLTCR
jgi:hypothetical protein